MRHIFYAVSGILFAITGSFAFFWPPALWALTVLVPVFLLGVRDSLQTRRAVLRNFPVIGHFRYLLEMIRPEINQYFIESNIDGKPFSREMRSVVYQRSKKTMETVPFGTQRNVYAPGYEWLNHSVTAKHLSGEEPRVRIGSMLCTQPYHASLLNISAMSFGSLSRNAILALNGGAKLGNFFHNTGEGSVSKHHRENGGDLVWQIGTGYFGCRDDEGKFSPDKFAQTAQLAQVKMIEIKLSQGAKPGHGGILPAAKLTKEIAETRGVPMGKDVLSPPSHSAFSTPKELIAFVQQLRELSNGKPVGFKLCVGHRAEFLGICKAMVMTGIQPDFITVDGGEGGTGAAPIEFSNYIGCPLSEGIVFVHNALVGFGLREQTKIIASGGIITGFHLARRIAAGADLCNSARGFMFSLGCIQALRCNSNECPVGVATQNPRLVRGLNVSNKTQRVNNFHNATVQAFLETIAAAGLTHPDQLRPWHIYRRLSHSQVKTYAEIHEYLQPGQLLEDKVPESWERPMSLSSPNSFRPEIYTPDMPPVGGMELEPTFAAFASATD